MQPRSLAAAFLDSVAGTIQGEKSIARLEAFCERLDAACGACSEYHYAMKAETDQGTLDGLIAFATG